LFHLSHNKYFNVDHLNCKFTDFFNKNNLINETFAKINDIKIKHLYVILPGLINIGSVDKKEIQILSTIFLRYTEKLNFEDLIKMGYFFSIADYENILLYKKLLDVINTQMLCIKNLLDGNDDMRNLIGILDTNYVDNLEKNVIKLKDKIRKNNIIS
jgi:hypothetical protein